MDAGCKKAHLVDQSGSATITLWGEWIDVMQHGNSYIFQHVRVREGNSERQLYTPLYGVSITATEKHQLPTGKNNCEFKNCSCIQPFN